MNQLFFDLSKRYIHQSNLILIIKFNSNGFILFIICLFTLSLYSYSDSNFPFLEDFENESKMIASHKWWKVIEDDTPDGAKAVRASKRKNADYINTYHLSTPRIYLPDSGKIELSFLEYLATWNDGEWTEIFLINHSKDKMFIIRGNIDPNRDWVTQYYNLYPFKGDTVTVRFIHTIRPSWTINSFGWCLDRIKISFTDTIHSNETDYPVGIVGKYSTILANNERTNFIYTINGRKFNELSVSGARKPVLMWTVNKTGTTYSIH